MDFIFSFFNKTYTSYAVEDMDRIITSAFACAGFLILLEIISAVFIRITEKRERIVRKALYVSIIKGLRSFIRFFLIFSFLRLIKSAAPAEYPINIIHRAVELALLYAGLTAAIFKVFNVVEKKKLESLIETPLTMKLVKISRRGLSVSIILLLLGLFFRQLRNSFPADLQDELWMSMIVLFNSVLLTAALLVAVDRILPPLEKLFKQLSGHNAVEYLVHSLAAPLKILIIALFFLSVKSLIIRPEILIKIADMVVEILVSAAVLLFLYKFFEIFMSRLSKYSELDTNSLDKTLIEMIHMIVRICFVTAAAFIIIRIITGKPLTTLLAGLGIGGLAVAFAAQDTLKNFFGSLMIMTDKPFKIGERIVAEGFDGVIESIGFRSTRIRTLTGNQVVIPNDKVAQAPIENIGRRASIRRLANITITYDTPPEKVEKALTIIREMLADHEGMLPDLPARVYFNEFNAESLNIIMLYWYSPPDYWEYMRFTEGINLKIMKAFAAEGIEFAFPTSTTYLEQADGKSIKLDLSGAPEKNK